MFLCSTMKKYSSIIYNNKKSNKVTKKVKKLKITGRDYSPEINFKKIYIKHLSGK